MATEQVCVLLCHGEVATVSSDSQHRTSFMTREYHFANQRAGFLSQFVWDGARDYSAFLAVEQCLDFWRRHPSALDYSRTLLLWASSFLSNRFAPRILTNLQQSIAHFNINHGIFSGGEQEHFWTTNCPVQQ